MIPTTHTDRKVTGSLGGERHLMSIDAANIPHLMGILTDLYSDNELAPIREYSTNARDSHIMAGIDEPILVRLPTPLRQTFEVQDFGLGLSVEEVINIYGSYGASTKRETNDANGMLGLGSKSALTYTNMFTVRAVKDEVQAEVAFFRNEDGSGAIEVVDTKGTDERNGVTVIIPTKANSQFREKAMRFYRTWDKGTVEVVGETIDFVKDSEDTFWIGNGLVVNPNTGYRHLEPKTYVVMGGVTYPTKISRSYRENYDVYYFAEIGDVDFVPSREELNYTPKTQAFIQSLGDEVDNSRVRQYIQAQVNTAKDLDEAYGIVQKFQWVEDYPATYFWNDINLATQYRFPVKSKVWSPEGEGVYQWVHTYAINLAEAGKYAFVKRPEDKSYTFKNKAQMRQLLEKKYPEVEFIVFGERPKDSFLSVKSKQIPWSKVLKEDVPKAKRSAKAVKPKAEYPMVQWDKQYGYVTQPYQPIPDKGTIIYTPNKINSVQRQYVTDNHKAIIVYVEDRRMEKFLRENPKAVTWKSIHDELANKLPEVSEAEKFRAYLDRFSWRREGRMDWLIANNFADDMLKEIAAVDTTALAKKRQMWDNVGRAFPETSVDYINQVWPLLNLDHEEHSRLYCEAIQKEGK